MSEIRKTKTGKPLGHHEVGYGRPPKATQFRKGQSGNPKGRKKKKQDASAIFRDLLDKKVSVRIDGETVVMTRREAMVHNLFSKAMGGSVRDLVAFKKYVDDIAPAALDPESKPVSRVVFNFMDVRDGQPTLTRTEWLAEMARIEKARTERGVPPVANLAELAKCAFDSEMEDFGTSEADEEGDC